MKTKEELNALKEEVETLNKKLAELTDEELAQVSGGGISEAMNCEYLNEDKTFCTLPYGYMETERCLYCLVVRKVESEVVQDPR